MVRFLFFAVCGVVWGSLWLPLEILDSLNCLSSTLVVNVRAN